MIYRYLFETLVSVLLGIYPKLELLDHVIIPLRIFWRTTLVFSTVAVPFYISIKSIWKFQVLHILTTACYYYFFFIVVILMVGRWYPVIVLVCISQMISVIKYLFMCSLATYICSLERCLIMANFESGCMVFFNWVLGVLYIFLGILITFQILLLFIC